MIRRPRTLRQTGNGADTRGTCGCRWHGLACSKRGCGCPSAWVQP